MTVNRLQETHPSMQESVLNATVLTVLLLAAMKSTTLCVWRYGDLLRNFHLGVTVYERVFSAAIILYALDSKRYQNIFCVSNFCDYINRKKIILT